MEVGSWNTTGMLLPLNATFHALERWSEEINGEMDLPKDICQDGWMCDNGYCQNCDCNGAYGE